MNERRNALITGASAGLGVSFARQLASKGYDLVLVARRGDRLRTVGKEIARDSGCSYHVIESDLMDVEAPQSIYSATQKKGLEIDYLVNNAGVAGLGEMKAGTPNFLWYGADTVVQESLVAVERGRRVLVSGRLYRWLDPLMQSVITRRFFHRRS